MIHTVHLDDNYVDVRNLLERMRNCKQGIHFENPILNGTPEEYLTVEQFRLASKRSLTNIMVYYL